MVDIIINPLLGDQQGGRFETEPKFQKLQEISKESGSMRWNSLTWVDREHVPPSCGSQELSNAPSGQVQDIESTPFGKSNSSPSRRLSSFMSHARVPSDEDNSENDHKLPKLTSRTSVKSSQVKLSPVKSLQINPVDKRPCESASACVDSQRSSRPRHDMPCSAWSQWAAHWGTGGCRRVASRHRSVGPSRN